MSTHDDIEEVKGGTGRFYRILADESHPVDRHCKCGRVILCPWALSCEVCDPQSVPMLMRRQAA